VAENQQASILRVHGHVYLVQVYRTEQIHSWQHRPCLNVCQTNSCLYARMNVV